MNIKIIGLVWNRSIKILPFMAALLSLGLASAQEIPIFDGDTLPPPPAQTQVWVAPPTKLPEEFVTASTELFKEGLADPRGCEYREVEVVVGSCWGDAYVTKTSGWVWPTGDKQKFGVCWNGLVYPLVTVGKPADLHADIG